MNLSNENSTLLYDDLQWSREYSDQQCVIIELRNQGIFQEMKLDKLIP